MDFSPVYAGKMYLKSVLQLRRKSYGLGCRPGNMSEKPMRRSFASPLMQGLVKPLGQMIVFILGSGAVLSLLMVLLALLLRGSAVDQLSQSRNGVDLFSFTLGNLPQVLVDGVTLGFVYAAIALGYTMVYGVLEFINFAHSEIFAIGAFVGVEMLIALQGVGRAGRQLRSSRPTAGWSLAILAGMAAAGLMAVLVERIAYRPLRNAPRLVPLISAIGVSFFLQDAIRLVESLTTGQFYRIIPTFGNFDERISIFNTTIWAARHQTGHRGQIDVGDRRRGGDAGRA